MLNYGIDECRFTKPVYAGSTVGVRFTVKEKIDQEKKDEDDLTPITSKNFSLEDLQKSWISKIENKTIFISALKKEFYEEFKTLLYGEVKKLHEKKKQMAWQIHQIKYHPISL